MDKLLPGHLKQNVLIVSNHNFHIHHATVMYLNFYNQAWFPTAITNSWGFSVSFEKHSFTRSLIPHPRTFFHCSQREEGRRRNVEVREKHWPAAFRTDWGPYTSRPGIEPATRQVPRQELNLQRFSLWDDAPTEPHRPGRASAYLYCSFLALHVWDNRHGLHTGQSPRYVRDKHQF